MDIVSYLIGKAAGGGGSGGGSPILAWDFTSATPLVDTVRGLTAGNNNVTFVDKGAKWDFASDYLVVPTLSYGITVEVDVVEMPLTSGQDRKFLTTNNGYGLIYRSSGKWAFYQNGAWEDSEIADGGYFSGHTAKIVIDAEAKWHIYRDNDLVLETTRAAQFYGITLGNDKQTAFYLGATSNAINNAIISAVRIY